MLNVNKILIQLVARTINLQEEKIVMEPLEFILSHSEDEVYTFIKERLQIDRYFFDKVVSGHFDNSYRGERDILSFLLNYQTYKNYIDRRILINENAVAIFNLNRATAILPHGLNTLQYLSEEHLNRIEKATSAAGLEYFVTLAYFFEVVGIDLEIMKHWDHKIDSVEEAIAALGFSQKSLLNVVINLSRKTYGTVGYLNELLTLKRLSNILNPKQTFRQIHHAVQVSYRNQKPLTVESFLNLFWDYATYDVLYGDNVGDEVFGGQERLLALYFNQYRQWSNSETIIDVDGMPIYIHHHTLIHHLANRAKDPNLVKPDNLKVHPKTIYTDELRLLAITTKEQMIEQYGNIKFPELPEPLKRLDPAKWTHISTPMDLILEGSKMSHCVGGEDYVTAACEGDVFFHYDDGTKHGLTIELKIENWNDYDLDWVVPMASEIPGDEKCFEIGQIYGKHNVRPTDSIREEIIRQLFNCITPAEVIAAGVSYRDYCSRATSSYKYLSGITTRVYDYELALYGPVYHFNIMYKMKKCNAARHLLGRLGRGVSNTQTNWIDMYGGQPPRSTTPEDRVVITVADEATGGYYEHVVGRVDDGDSQRSIQYHIDGLNEGLRRGIMSVLTGGRSLRLKNDYEHPTSITDKKYIVSAINGNSKGSVVIPLKESYDGRRAEEVISERNNLAYDFTARVNSFRGHSSDEKISVGQKLIMRLMARRVMYGLIPETDIRRYIERFKTRPLTVLQPLYTALVFAEGGQYSTIHANELLAGFKNRGKQAIVGPYNVEAVQYGEIPAINLNEPLTREFFGFHGALASL